jgi:hypothetical protein
LEQKVGSSFIINIFSPRYERRTGVLNISPFSLEHLPLLLLCLTLSLATGFSEKFPGLSPHLLTLSTNFIIPFYRELILSLGICSVSIKSCISILKSKNKRASNLAENRGEGNCLIIVVGGAAESLSAHPGTADLTLKRRLGFIKLAIREG